MFELNRDNVMGVLLAANYLAMDFLVKKCTDFYTEQLEMDNDMMVDVKNLHHTYGHITSLKLAVEKSDKHIKVKPPINIWKLFLILYESELIIFRKISRIF